MPAPKGNNFAKGNKGGGRLNGRDEAVKMFVVTKSWERIKDKFQKTKKTPQDEKDLDIISLEVAKKTIPKDINISGEISNKIKIEWMKE